MNAIIQVDGVSKAFLQPQRSPGFWGALRGLVTRRYTEFTAVRDVSFQIQPGEAVGYLGRNGAGKSTMIKMLTGILVPSGGRISVLGKTPHLHRIANAREIGVVFGQRSQLWWDLPVMDSFLLHKEIYKIDDATFQANLREFANLLELGKILDRPVRQLSLGQRMRAEVVMALLHNPKVLFLDEPTIGLDLIAKDALRRFLAEVNKQRSITIILTTHDLMDIDQICPRLIMVDEGTLLFDGALSELRRKFGGSRRMRLEFSKDPGVFDLSNARLVRDEGIFKHYAISRRDVSLLTILADVPATFEIKDVLIEEPGIEDVVRQFYGSTPGTLPDVS